MTQKILIKVDSPVERPDLIFIGYSCLDKKPIYSYNGSLKELKLPVFYAVIKGIE